MQVRLWEGHDFQSCR